MTTWLVLNGAMALRDSPESNFDTGAQAGAWTGDYRPALSDRPLGRGIRVWRWHWLRELANSLKGPPRVGVQVGHLDAGAQPDELAALRASTGGHWEGVDEVEVNLEVANRLAKLLEDDGIVVDVLPATIPPGYVADVMLSVHVDASSDESRRGYKSAHFWPARNVYEPLLKVLVDREVLAMDLPDDDRNVSGNMLQYYAFNHRRYRHAVDRSTPALLVELGYLSSPQDRHLLADPNSFALALAQGVRDYLQAVGRTP